MLNCPNISHHWWKELVDKIGEDNAYLEYLRNGEDIPDPANYNKIEVRNPIDEAINHIWAINTPSDALPDDVQRELRGLDIGDAFTIKYEDGKFNLYTIDLEYTPKFGLSVTKEGNLIPDIIDIKKELGAKILIKDISARQIRTFLKLSDARELFEQDEKYALPVTELEDSLLLPGFEDFFQQQQAIDTFTNHVLAFYLSHPNTTIWRHLITGNEVTEQPESLADYKKATRYWHLNDAFKDFEQTLNSIIDYYPDNKSFKHLKEALPQLKDKVRDKINTLGLLGNKKLLEDYEMDDSDLTEIDNAFRPDEWVFKWDSKSNALKQVKQFLSFIPKTEYDKTTKQYIQVDNYLATPELHTPQFMSYDAMYEELKAILTEVDVDPTWDSMSKKLQEFTISKPWIHTLLENIDDTKSNRDVERLKHQFVSSMSSAYSNAKTLLWKEKNGNYYLNIIDTDQTSVIKTIQSIWSSGYRTSELVKTDEENNLVTDQDKVKEIITRIDNLQDTKDFTGINEKVSKLLEDIGIIVSPETANELVHTEFNKLTWTAQFTAKEGLFRLIKERLEGKQTATNEEEIIDEDEEQVNSNNPVVNNSAIKALARVEARNSDYTYSNSYRNGEGQVVYSYTFNKALTRKYKRLMTDKGFVDQLLNITFTKPILKDNKVIYKTWLYQLQNNYDSFSKIFSISPFDTIRQNRAGSTGLKLTGMSDLDLETTQVSLIQNSGHKNKGVGRVIKHLVTIPSKTTSYIVQGVGHDTQLFFYPNGSYSFNSITENALYSIAASEHNRIISQEAKENQNKAYKNGSSKFFFFPILNQEDSPELYNADGTVKLPTTIIGNRSVEQIIKSKIIASIKTDIADKIKTWTQLGIVDNNKLKIVDSKYKKEIVNNAVGQNEANQITFAATDYIINQILAKFNMHQMFIGDPALYYKTDIKTTWDNLDKRLAALIAPGSDLSLFSTDEKFVSIKLIDREKGNSALNYAQLQRRLSNYYEDQGKANPYEEINGTDAQEYTTLKEHLLVQYRRGLLATDTYNNIISRINKEGDDLVLTKEDLDDGVLGAVKPVYSDSLIDTEGDVATEQYVKSSSIPLIPQFTTGLQIDKLRKAMEAHERKTGLNVRAVFNSGTKVGGLKSINIWNLDGTIKDDLDLEGYGVTLDRTGFSIQQDIPYDEKQNEVVKATQPTKQLFDGLQDVKGFNYKGASVGGKFLQEIYNDLHKELYERGLRDLHNRILTNGRLDIPKLQKIILEEGETREYTPAELSFLKLNPLQKNFEIPFWANPSSSKIESLITSLYTNNVLKQKLHGHSYVLVSEEGFQGISKGVVYTDKSLVDIVNKTNEDILTEELTDEQKKKVVNIRSTDPTDDSDTIEEQDAETAIEEIKKQHKRLEDLLNCLNK